jgi:NOL1/NOP2/sun family putative RNA methylase
MIEEFLRKKLNSDYSNSEIEKIISGLKEEKISSFRVNRIKSCREEIEEDLKLNNISYQNVDYDKDAFIISAKDEDRLFDLDIYKDGYIYIQSLSSMMPVLFMDLKDNQDILDMTAAPGGKTTQIASKLNNNANITALEMNKIRYDRLKYNIDKQGARVNILEKDARNIEDFYKFDNILLDSPCSGSGTLNLNIENENFNDYLIDKCNKSQIKLLEKAIKLLKVNSTMIYSTCSILKKENEDVINYILEKYSNIELVPLEKIEYKNIEYLDSKEGTITVMPNKYYEGFFIAKLKKIK